VFFVSSIDGGRRKSKGFSNRAVHDALTTPPPGKNTAAAIPGEESRPISWCPAPQRLGPYGKIVRSRSQHMSGERQHPRRSPTDPIISRNVSALPPVGKGTDQAPSLRFRPVL